MQLLQSDSFCETSLTVLGSFSLWNMLVLQKPSTLLTLTVISYLQFQYRIVIILLGLHIQKYQVETFSPKIVAS